MQLALENTDFKLGAFIVARRESGLRASRGIQEVWAQCGRSLRCGEEAAFDR